MTPQQQQYGLRVVRNLTYILYDGRTLDDGSCLCPDRVILERETESTYVILLTPDGETAYQTGIAHDFIPTVKSLCAAMGVRVTEMDLSK